jgi:hypothetical protein
MGTDQPQVEARYRERVDDPVYHDARPKIAAREPPDEAQRQAERAGDRGPRRPLVEVEQAEDDRLADDCDRRSDGTDRRNPPGPLSTAVGMSLIRRSHLRIRCYCRTDGDKNDCEYSKE